jgi:hypothetical protein
MTHLAVQAEEVVEEVIEEVISCQLPVGSSQQLNQMLAHQ